MKDTAEESADLKQALKNDVETIEIAAEAEAFPLEADEAFAEVEDGYAVAAEGSWVANRRSRV